MKIGITPESHQLLDISTLDRPLVSLLFAKSTEVKKKHLILFYIFEFFFFKMEMINGFISVRRNNGSAPSHWRAGSGSIGRKALQALEQLKLVEKDPNGGRRLTSQGRRDLDRIAAQVYAVSQKQI